MKYFFLIFLTLVLLVLAVAGLRGGSGLDGRHSPNRPLEFFPDMVRQSKLKPQSPDKFFANGVSGQLPIVGTAPMGYDIPGHTAFSQLGAEAAGHAPAEQPRLRYTEAPDYYDTGKIGASWGTGIPIEVTPALMERGRDRFIINCQVCHGGTGSGNGVTSKYGLNGIANYHDEKYLKMADGEIYNTITNGHNTMLGYGANLTVQDRWAIVTYIRSLQRSQLVKLEELPPAERQGVLAATP